MVHQEEDIAAEVASCIVQAEYVEDLKEMIKLAGFTDARLTPKDNSQQIISSWVQDKNAEDYVASYIIEAVK